MAKNKKYTVGYKRKGKTNYKKRLKYLASNKPRLVIRPSLKNIHIQIVEFAEKGDKILFSASSRELKKLGWQFNCGNIPSAYLTGLLIGKKAKDKIKENIADFGFKEAIKQSRICAALKGAIDSGLKIPHSKEVFPSEERTKGLHIQKYSEIAKEHQFSKQNNIKNLAKNFEEVKSKILRK
jgi:large subunit ribosomal protein L18